MDRRVTRLIQADLQAMVVIPLSLPNRRPTQVVPRNPVHRLDVAGSGTPAWRPRKAIRTTHRPGLMASAPWPAYGVEIGCRSGPGSERLEPIGPSSGPSEILTTGGRPISRTSGIRTLDGIPPGSAAAHLVGTCSATTATTGVITYTYASSRITDLGPRGDLFIYSKPRSTQEYFLEDVYWLEGHRSGLKVGRRSSSGIR